MMIDWWNIFTHSLWIAGLAAALAIFSHADWQASTKGHGLKSALKHVSQSPGFALAMALICLGAGLGVVRWWERMLWLALAVGALSLAGWQWFSQRKGSPS
jgi:hypothetical protein